MPRSIDVHPHVRSVMDPDGAVLLDLRQGRYYSLNGVGAEIWSQIESGRSVPEIESHLVGALGAPRDAARADVAAFVDDLRKKNLVHARD
jgi:hypothetical protein